MPASTPIGCSTSSPIVPSALIRCTLTRGLGMLCALSVYWPDGCTHMCVARCTSLAASPCGESAPVAGSIAHALMWLWSAGSPGPRLLVVTYNQRFDGCGHAYCTNDGALTVSRLVSVAAS